jgi:hypothetical protein
VIAAPQIWSAPTTAALWILLTLGTTFIQSGIAQPKAIALLRSFGAKKGPLSYKHLAPLGRSNSSSVVFEAT